MNVSALQKPRQMTATAAFLAEQIDMFPWTLDEYQAATALTDIMKDWPQHERVIVNSIGLAEEAGKCLGHVKTTLADHNGHFSPEVQFKIVRQLGSALWYMARLAAALGVKLSLVAAINLGSTMDRKQARVLKGVGDDR